jgi:hypothetical protein
MYKRTGSHDDQLDGRQLRDLLLNHPGGARSREPCPRQHVYVSLLGNLKAPLSKNSVTTQQQRFGHLLAHLTL